jgi:hypothetical protein
VRVNPVSKEVADAGGFGEPWPAGTYDFTVYQAEEGVSQAGNEQIVLTLHIFNREGDRRTVFDYLGSSDKVQWKVRHFAESVGLTKQYDAGDLMPMDINERSGQCKIGIQKAQGAYAAKNVVADYLGNVAPATAGTGYTGVSAPRAPAREKVGAGVGTDLDDEIPFAACWQ